MGIAPGDSLGPYEILARLGQGGMGEVWKAKDRRLGRIVALKVLRGDDAGAVSGRRLLRESQIASRLTHPNICTLHDVGSGMGIDYLVMELLEGETLQARLARGRMEADELVRVAREMAEALAHAHRAGVVHRDLKPSNVFLTPVGVKLLDFGLARRSVLPDDETWTESATVSALTRPGTFLGTVGYVSPEQVRGELAGPPSDVFSFGAVLFEMATGARAFRGETAVETLHAILKGEPPPFPEEREALPAGLGAIVERCLEKDPARRFPSAVELAEALASPPPAVAARRPVPRHGRRRAVAVAATAAAVLAVALAGFLVVRSRAAAALDSLAILPLANATGDPGLTWVAESLTESLIRTAGRFPEVRVMAASTVARFGGASTDPIAAGRALNVKAVLTGSVRSAGERLGVTVSLVDVQDGHHLWGESYERDGDKVPALQAEIAAEIARALRVRLSGDAKREITRVGTQDREAYLLTLKGRYHWGKRTGADLKKALDLFREALDRDPAYAPAWAGLAATWDVLGYVGYRPKDEAFPRAKDAARKALEIDPADTVALAVLAHATWLHDRDAAAAEALFRRALEIDPAAVDARHWYAHFLAQTGRRDESFRQGRKLLELEPLSLVVNLHLGEDLELQGRRDEAAEQFRKTIDLDPNFYPAWLLLAKLEIARGRTAEALAALKEVERIEPDAPTLAETMAAARRGGAAPPAR